jgi:hypothetical protein
MQVVQLVYDGASSGRGVFVLIQLTVLMVVEVVVMVGVYFEVVSIQVLVVLELVLARVCSSRVCIAVGLVRR